MHVRDRTLAGTCQGCMKAASNLKRCPCPLSESVNEGQACGPAINPSQTPGSTMLMGREQGCMMYHDFLVRQVAMHCRGYVRSCRKTLNAGWVRWDNVSRPDIRQGNDGARPNLKRMPLGGYLNSAQIRFLVSCYS